MKLADAVSELNPADDLPQTVAAVDFAPFRLGGHHQPEGHGQAGFSSEAALGALRSMSEGGERALGRVGRANVIPVFRGLVVEAQERVPVFDQFGGLLVPFHAESLDEEVEGDVGFGFRFGLPDVVQVRLRLGLNRYRRRPLVA